MREVYPDTAIKPGFMLGLCMLLLFGSCQKKEILGEDPYAGGKEALGVRFIGDYPSPESGAPGSEVTFKVRGLKSWEDKFEFFINDELAEVVDLTDSTVRVIVPEEASSGGASVRLEGQVFFGPRMNIEGNVSIDENYKVINGTNGPISDAIAFQSGLVLVGSFSNFEGKATTTERMNSIVSISSLGEYQANINSRKGANGVISSINRLSNGKYIASGLFTSYNDIEGINSITRLNADFSVDSSVIDVINLTPDKPLNALDTVATFNGGVFGYILDSYVSNTDNGEQITVVGNFEQYGSYFYERATRDYKPMDVTSVRQLIRLDVNGRIDSAYNFNEATQKFNAGGNGEILGSVLMPDNKLILVGNFTSFHGKSANRIVRLDANGEVDPTFNAGSGANELISSIQFDTSSGKFLLVGRFTSFDGQPANRVVRLNADGSVDHTFKILEFAGGEPNFAYQMKNGRVIVSGTFERYNNVVRRGFLILNNDGSVTQKYNNVGRFEGSINKVVETTSALGNPAVILMGYIRTFNDQRTGNIVRVEVKE